VQPQGNDVVRERLQRNDAAQQLALRVNDQVVAVGQADGDVLIDDRAAGKNDAVLPLLVRQGLGIVTCLLYTSPSPRD